MAGSGRKNKRAGKSKARQAVQKALKDPNSDNVDVSDQLSEELTALAAIFQDDFNLVSEKPFVEFSINVRPHSNDDEESEDYAAVQLVVKCLNGYPLRPPKLQVLSKKGLNDDQLRYLHSMLTDVAASRAREGSVMIFNLTEAAQEFLSEQRREIARESDEDETDNEESGGAEQDWQNGKHSPVDVAENDPRADDCVYLELFNNLWSDGDVQVEQNPVSVSSERPADSSRGTGAIHKHEQFWKDTRRSGPLLGSPKVTKILAAEELPKKTDRLLGFKNPSQVEGLEFAEECSVDHSENGFPASPSEKVQQLRAGLSSANDSPEDLAIKSSQKDLVLGYLLRLVCSPKGPLPKALPVLASELQKNGILSDWAEELVATQPDVFDATFRRTFYRLSKDTDRVSQTGTSAFDFWSANPELLGEGRDDSSASSRYLSDFEEISLLGRGGFGHVVLCKNKLDGRRYAMKKIRLKDKNPLSNEKILREVATLARLQHQHVVRYYQAWIETGVQFSQNGMEDSGSSANWFVHERLETGNSFATDFTSEDDTMTTVSTFLYIQMEYCPKTLRELFESQSWSVDKDEIWRMFRQLVEGLAHIHGQGILHRDLNPNNIFFDPRGNIKIGDFGLAKFTSLEQSDKDINPPDASEVTAEDFQGTGKVGTYFYTAPEVDQGSPHIDVKVDIYSIGVVFLEFWYPFGTGMERYNVLNQLKQKQVLPAEWSMEFADQAKLIYWLMSPSPADRPSAAQVLRSELLPPRMENEFLNDILRTIQMADDTSVYDQVVAALFDTERISSRAGQADAELAQMSRCEKDKSLVKLVGVQNQRLESVREVFVLHGARCVESSRFNVVGDDEFWYPNRQVVSLLDSSGNLLDARFESRQSLARWVAVRQRLSLRSYELSPVYRRGVGDNPPREYFQGDFDIIGGTRTLAEAECVKVAVEVVSKFPALNVVNIRINHHQILRAIWTWAGVQSESRQKVAQILAVLGGAQPQSSARKALWPFVRRQLLQSLQLPETVVDRLQTVERRLSGSAREVLPRLRGALPPDDTTIAAIDEISTLLRYFRVWSIESGVILDSLMTPTESYYSGFYFQVYVQKVSIHSRNSPPAVIIAVGGCYDQLIAKQWSSYAASPATAPCAVGLTIAVQTLIDTSTAERSDFEAGADVLVCSKGGGGLLVERMKIVNDLWAANIKAEYVCSEAPSLTEQYEYANENGIKWLVIITEAALSLSDSVKVRHLDLKVEEDVPKEELVKYFSDMGSTSVNLRKKANAMRSTY